MTSSIELTKAQKDKILSMGAFLPLDTITKEVFSNDSIDGRSKEGRAIRNFMRENGYEPETSSKKKREPIILNSNQKSIVSDFVSDQGTDIFSLAVDVFPYLKDQINLPGERDENKKRFSPIWLEWRALEDEIDLIKQSNLNFPIPNSINGAIRKINEATGKKIDKDRITMNEKFMIEKFLENLKTPRFLDVLKDLIDNDEKSLFIKTYIAHIWDKPDLGTDDLSLYINICWSYLTVKRSERDLNAIRGTIRQIRESGGSVDKDLLDEVKSLEDAKTTANKQVETILKQIENIRTKKRADKASNKVNILSLVQSFREYETRQLMIKAAEVKRLAVKKEIEKLTSMEKVKALFMGISSDEM